jgi:predicted TIM-barrel fold metal-dependent hydrolase
MPDMASRPFSRRNFIRRSVIGATAAWSSLNDVLARRLAAEPAEPLAENTPIIDTHQHLWDLDRFRLPWLEPKQPLRRNYLLRDYQQAAAGLNIVRTIYMEVDVAVEQKQAEAEFVIGLCENRAQTHMSAAVVGARIADDNFAKYVRQFRGHPYVKGVRQVTAVPLATDGLSLERRFLLGIRLLGELNLSFDLCCAGEKLQDAEKLIAACPDTRFILDHCGNPDVLAKDQPAWKRGIEAVARHERVMCKVSGIVASAGDKWKVDELAPIVRHVRESFGPDRLMFGGDWPVCTKTATLRQWVEALRQIVHDWPVAEQCKLFHDNAMRCYALPA